MSKKKPLLAITMGDPAGIGPETIARAWGEPAFHEACDAVALGHPEIFRRAVALVGSSANVVPIASIDERKIASDIHIIPCLACGTDDALAAPPGEIDARAGQAAYDALLPAIDLALAGRVDGIVTAPLHKAALRLAGHQHPGHTELLAERCGVRDFAMMLYLGPSPLVHGPAGLGVVHVTLHVALRDVFAGLDRREIVAKTHLADRVMRRLRRFHGLAEAAPRIGVAALNPHGGEKGLFGDEEQTIIAPAVEQARSEGVDASGPWPADTLFARAREGRYDAVVAMYHDQGHIALKLLDQHRAVNVTLGLPIVRTSVAHGTAFDLAWQGKAQHGGMIEAVRVAAGLAGEKLE